MIGMSLQPSQLRALYVSIPKAIIPSFETELPSLGSFESKLNAIAERARMDKNSSNLGICCIASWILTCYCTTVGMKIKFLQQIRGII